MATQIFINLPVTDLQKSIHFYESIGFSNNPQFTDETAACMVLSEHIYVMLLTHEKLRQFTPKTIANAKNSTEVLNALTRDSREEVDRLMVTAVRNGGNEFRPTQDYGFMYGRAFEDLDGHIWELIYMDMSQFPQQ